MQSAKSGKSGDEWTDKGEVKGCERLADMTEKTDGATCLRTHSVVASASSQSDRPGGWARLGVQLRSEGGVRVWVYFEERVAGIIVRLGGGL